MRVISGKARGVTLMTPKGEHTRPTADRVKEALFSIIQFDLPGSKVLDLFGGTGQLGIEALSRGAASAVFVDAREESCRLIRENLKRTKLEQDAKLTISGIVEGMKTGKLTVTADNGFSFTVNCDLTYRQQAILLAGGLLNYTKEGGQ